MSRKRSSPLMVLLLSILATAAVCGGVSPASGADAAGAAAQTKPAVEVPAIPMPAARNMRYSLAEKRAAIEGRKKMKAEIAARKAAQQPPAVESAQ